MQSRLSTKQTLRALAILLAFAGVIAFTLSISAAYAQSATASLSGVALDEKGAVVAGAKITLVNAATALKREAKTNSDGLFTLPLLPPGSYTVSAQCDGFRPVDLRDIVLNVGDQRSVHITLRVGSVTASVEVAGGTSLLNESLAVSTVVDRQFVENQPLNGRSFQTLIGLTPGVVFTPTVFDTGGQFSVNGQRAGTNYFTVDGVSANFGSSRVNQTLYDAAGGGTVAFSAQGTTSSLASVDAVQEFAIQTSTFAPEFGRTPGAQVQIVTRSGTNDFRGSVFNYLRNDVFDANDYFANRNGLPKPPLRQNDFGFTLGGPVFLPSFYNGRDRTLFFVSYEGLRLRQPVVGSPEQVPSLSARQNATGVIRDILNGFPLPNGPTLPGDPNTATFVGSFSNPSNLDATSVRLDHSINDNLSIFGRYNYAPSEVRPRAFFSSSNTISPTTSRTQTLTVGSTLIFSPRTSNDLRINYSEDRTSSSRFLDGFGGAVVPPDSVFFPSFAPLDNALSTFAVGTNRIIKGLSFRNTQRQLNVVNTLSHIIGSHALKFGVDYRRLFPVSDLAAYGRLVNFANVATALTGNVTSGNVFRTDFDLFPIYNNYSLFAQDAWRATSRLTLTYGLRYEVNPAPTEKNDNLPLTAIVGDTPSAATLAPRGTRFYETTYNNFAPRVGVAYQLFPERGTVVRGGFGVFYDLGNTFTGTALQTNFVPVPQLTFAASGTPLSAPVFSTPPPSVPPTPPFGSLAALVSYEQGYMLPYTLQYNVAIEQSLGKDSAVLATYVGAAGRRLGRVERLQSPNPTFILLSVVRNDAASDYNALQLQYQRRLSRGLQALASYTFSKSLDNVSEESNGNFQAPIDNYDPRQDRGPSSFDLRHSFSAAVSYEIPSFFDSGLGRAVFGNFAVDSLFRARSATPVNVIAGVDPFGFGFSNIARPDLVPGVPLYIDDPAVAGGRRFNRAAFDAATPTAARRQGTLGRNALRGFPAWQLDVSLRRQFNLSERVKFRFQVDAFNILNHPNLANRSGNLSDSNFGVSTQMLNRGLGGLSPLYQIGGPRSLQFALKLNF